MKHLRKLFVAMTAAGAMVAVTFVASSDAFAQLNPPCTDTSDCSWNGKVCINGFCQNCTDDNQCTGFDEVCYNGSCETLVCSASGHSDNGTTTARFNTWPGNAIVVVGYSQDYYTTSGASCTVGEPDCDQMEYRSHYIPDTNACGGNSATSNRCTASTSFCQTDSNGQLECYHMNCSTGPHEFRHKETVRSGKYSVTDTGERCSATGAYIVELTPCAL